MSDDWITPDSTPQDASAESSGSSGQPPTPPPAETFVAPARPTEPGGGDAAAAAASAPTQVGPPRADSFPPPAPQPPVAQPPVAQPPVAPTQFGAPHVAPPAPAAQGFQGYPQPGQGYGAPGHGGPGYGAPPPSGGSGKGPLLAVIAVLVALVLVAGGVTAFLLLRGDDDPSPSARSSEDPSEPGPSGSSEPEEPDEPESPAPRDAAAIEADLSAAAVELFPSGTPRDYVRAANWSVAADNIVDGVPRELTGPERESATHWEVAHASGDYRFWIYVQQVASDFRTGDCGETDTSSSCRQVTTPSGATAYEAIYTYEGGGSRYLWVIGDTSTGLPDITIGESFSGLTGTPTPETLTGYFQLDLAAELAALEDPRLQVPLTPTPPPLPSYYACAYSDTPPSSCPESLS